MNLKTQQLSSLEQVRSFMAGTDAVPFITQAHQDRYQWVALSLKQFAYERLRRAERGLIVRFLCKITGYSRAQITRLIAQWRCRGRLTDRRGPPATPFAKHYGAIELRLLADLDSLHGTLSGPATKKLAERAFTVYKQPHYETLAGISVSHRTTCAAPTAIDASTVRSCSTLAPRPYRSGSGASPTPMADPVTCAWTPCTKGISMGSRASILSTRLMRLRSMNSSVPLRTSASYSCCPC